jgi:hypothetical protein
VSDVAIDIGSIIEVWVSWPVEVKEISRLELRMTGRVMRSSNAETAIQAKRHDFVRVERARNDGAGFGSLAAGVSPKATTRNV